MSDISTLYIALLFRFNEHTLQYFFRFLSENRNSGLNPVPTISDTPILVRFEIPLSTARSALLCKTCPGRLEWQPAEQHA